MCRCAGLAEGLDGRGARRRLAAMAAARRRCQQQRFAARHLADLKLGRDARTTASVAASIGARTRRAERGFVSCAAASALGLVQSVVGLARARSKVVSRAAAGPGLCSSPCCGGGSRAAKWGWLRLLALRRLLPADPRHGRCCTAPSPQPPTRLTSAQPAQWPVRGAARGGAGLQGSPERRSRPGKAAGRTRRAWASASFE